MGRWDIFCRVVDNYGDIGTCWRLAQQLAAEHGADVRLWVDRLQSFAQLCPAVSADAEVQHVERIEIRRWRADFSQVEAADVVIEAFACELPESYIAAMARQTVAPAWINLEYLSAEAWVEDCHRLSSLRTKWPLTKYFFFPGFTSRTGGLLQNAICSPIGSHSIRPPKPGFGAAWASRSEAIRNCESRYFVTRTHRCPTCSSAGPKARAP